MFTKLYDTVLRWARHRLAVWYLAGLSFAESSFFPIPPDVMLMPMCLAKPKRAWNFAAITTLASVVGGMLGYGIGVFALDMITPLISEGGRWQSAFERATQWFNDWGFWAVLLAGFSPIPYKVFTISAGAVAMPFLPFVMASIIGRGGRFFLVAGLLAWGGSKIAQTIRRYVDVLGWLMVVLIVVGIVVYKNSH
jgi:membrane protein YqaA with SNARE-associated domain